MEAHGAGPRHAVAQPYQPILPDQGLALGEQGQAALYPQPEAILVAVGGDRQRVIGGIGLDLRRGADRHQPAGHRPRGRDAGCRQRIDGRRGVRDALPEQRAAVLHPGRRRPAIAHDEVAPIAELEGERTGVGVAAICGRRHEAAVGNDDGPPRQQPPVPTGRPGGAGARRTLRLHGNDKIVRHLPGAVEIGRLSRAQRDGVERPVHALGDLGEFVGVEFLVAAQRLPDGDQFDQDLHLHLGAARPVQPVIVDLFVEQPPDAPHPRPELGLVALPAQAHADQRDGGKQGVDRLGGERAAHPERLDLGAERTSDGGGLLHAGAFDQQVVVPEPVEDAPGAQRGRPCGAVEAAEAADPVECQSPGKAALLVGAGIAEMAQPGKGLQVVEPVAVLDRDGEGRDAVGIDEPRREQVAALHHLEHGFPVGRPEFPQPPDPLVAGRTRPGPSHERRRHREIGKLPQRPAREETQRVCQVLVPRTLSAPAPNTAQNGHCQALG